MMNLIRNRIYNYIAIFLGILLFVFACLCFQENYHLYIKGLVTTGSITEIIPLKNNRSSRHKKNTTITFTATNQKTYSFKIKSSHYQLGEKVAVIYSPSDPNLAKINNFIEIWLINGILFIGSIILIVQGFKSKLWTNNVKT